MIAYEIVVGSDHAEAETISAAMLAARTLVEDNLAAGENRSTLLPSIYMLLSRSGRRLLSEALSDRALHEVRPLLVGPRCPVCEREWPEGYQRCVGCGATTDDVVLAVWRQEVPK